MTAGTQPFGGGARTVQINFTGTGERRRAFDQVDESDLGWLYRRYEPPRGFAQAQSALDKYGVVLLEGQPGTGRRTAAKMLLRLYADAGHLFRIVSSEDSSDEFRSDEVADGDLLLLDLSQVDRDRYGGFRRSAANLRAKVGEVRSAKLVVILNPLLETQVERDESRQYTVSLGRPDWRIVLQRHLAAGEVVFRGRLPEPEGFQKHLAGASMDKLARFAEAVRGRAEWRTEPSDLRTLLQGALSAVFDQQGSVRTELGKCVNGAMRALAFAAAMLEGEHGNVVFQATEILLKIVAHPGNETPVLERDSLYSMLEEIHLEVDEHGSVYFKKFGYGRAVAGYFWGENPHLHESLREWVAQVYSHLEQRSQLVLAGRAAEQCLAADRPGHLLSLAEQWCADRRGAESAAVVLRAGLEHSRHGRTFRGNFYEWAKSPDLPKELAGVIADLCVSTVAPAYPEQALTRLRWLTQRRRDHVDAVAVEKLLGLLRSNLRIYRRLLWWLADDTRRGGGQAEDDLIRRVLHPDMQMVSDFRGRHYSADPVVQRCAGRLWRRTLRALSGPEWREYLQEWLAGCTKVENSKVPVLVRVVVGSVRDEPRTLAAVFVIARDWARNGTDRAECMRVAGVVRRCIDEAQGWHSR
ncbi:hypothetical protein D5S19_27750 [Amycolatopsis panacis]|uniref:Novel STAND NTPase 3 domain-containing protein n=1 Tax=Amycolatopsis panacis TaxID=2340917 RepID=A0A419HPI0_9PSEU|nr:hypothetical protein D5S19_27750 [Amycolatopsis panacis]